MLTVALVALLSAGPSEFAPLTARDGGVPPRPSKKPPRPDAGSEVKPPPPSATPAPLFPDAGTGPCTCVLGAPGWPGYLPPPRQLPDGGMGTEVDQNLEFLADWRKYVVDRLKDCPVERRDEILADNGRWECWQIKSFARPSDFAAADLADAKRFKVAAEVERIEQQIASDEHKGRMFGLAFAISFGQVARALESKAEYDCEWGGDPGPPPQRTFPSCPHARSYGFGTSASPGPKVTATPKDPPEKQYRAAVWARRWGEIQKNIAHENEWQIGELRDAGVGDDLAIKAARQKISSLCSSWSWIRGQETADHTVSDAFLAQARLFHETLLWLDPKALDAVPCSGKSRP